MLTAQKILPVILVSIVAIPALAFMLTQFAEQITGQASFQAHAIKTEPAKIKEVCVFKNPGLDCKNQQNTKVFCKIGMETPTSITPMPTHCTSGYITCELPCGTSGANCITGKGEMTRKQC